MSTSFSDKKLDLHPEQLAIDFYEDVWCIIKRYLPEMKRALTPQLHAQSATVGELQHCISILLFHSASKAQALHYRAGLRAINSCFKHFMYLCSHVNNITPNAAIKILDGIDAILAEVIQFVNPSTRVGEIDLKNIDDAHIDRLTTNLDLILQEMVNKV